MKTRMDFFQHFSFSIQIFNWHVKTCIILRCCNAGQLSGVRTYIELPRFQSQTMRIPVGQDDTVAPSILRWPYHELFHRTQAKLLIK